MRAFLLVVLVLGSFEISDLASVRAVHVGVATFHFVLFDFGSEVKNFVASASVKAAFRRHAEIHVFGQPAMVDADRLLDHNSA